MTMSIFHRATGIANYFGVALFVIWLLAAAFSADALNVVNGIYGSWFGQIVMFLFSWSLVHHMCGGIRHFVWDTAALMEPGQREKMAWATIIASVVITLVIWTAFVWVG